ncbi:MAG: hypothetical protein AAGA85_19140 [Bacteroidota bacterium]
MKLSALSLGFWLGWQPLTDQQALEVLNGYISWTTTGHCELQLFDERTRFIFPGADHETGRTLFMDYGSKIEGAARSIVREMSVVQVRVLTDLVEAEIIDRSHEHSFSLIHRLTLRRAHGTWRIQEIRIEAAQ